jgi:hypothetical protein
VRRNRIVRKTLTALALLLTLAVPARALNTQDILSLVEMPLAVAAVSQLAGVPQDQLANLLGTLNQANVPPTQFVQVVRYVPVALVEQPQPFVNFVNTQASQGITGPALVTSIDQNLTTNYGLTPVVQPDRIVYVDDSYIPQTVVSRLSGSDALAVTLMPLAVAAVSDLAGVPQDQLASLVSTLNQANVPPAQFVQVVEYAPVALTTTTSQPFVPFVQTQVAQGVTGPALVAVIDQRMPQYGVTRQYVPPPQVTVVTRPMSLRARPQPAPVYVPQYVPPPQHVVVAEHHNPHGGPPGQLKKIEGLRTGAEVVHGEKPGHGKRMVVVPPPMASAAPPMPVPMPAHVPPGQAKKEGGEGHGEGHGNGKGHGKD